MSTPPPRARGDAKVEAVLQRRLRTEGRITFADYMATALYLPEGGYYESRVALGRAGDFLTSPETHPVFGALLARLLWRQWHALNRPARFEVVEYGAGTGALSRQILAASATLNPGFADALRYTIIEASSYLRAEQHAHLRDLSGRVTWEPPDPQEACGCVLANEVVDALPVHRVTMEGGRLRELYVCEEDGRLVEQAGPPSTPDLEEYLRRVEAQLPEGAVAEVCLQARPWLMEAAARLARGYVLLLDYGGPASRLYSEATPRGQLKCFYRHGWTEDPYDRPGLQDITAPVDFTNLARASVEAGLVVSGELSQQELLRHVGMARALQEVGSLPLPVMERERNLRAMRMLVSPEGFGAFRVLLAHKAAPAPHFQAADMEAELCTPLLPAIVNEW